MTLIHGSYCKSCNHVVVPPREVCPYCGLAAGEMESVDLKPDGTIVSFTTLEMPPSGFAPPVLLALVELERGATVLSIGEEESAERIEIGSKVILYYGDDGLIRFVPSPDES